MDFRQLEMLLAVAENQSFTLAGQHLNVSQSAISRKIKLLEAELGIELFKRVNKRVYVTSAGETLVRCARRVFQDISHTSMEISEIAQMRGGHVRIASGMTACIFLLPPLLEKFKAKYPQLEVEIVTGPTELLLSQVLNNSIDLGVFTLPVESPALEVIPFCDDEMVVVTSTTNADFYKRKTIRASELIGQPLITFGKGSYTRKVLEEFFIKTEAKPRITMELESVATIKPLVKIGLGISILPLRSVLEEVKRRELHYLKIRDYKLSRQLGVVFQKSDPRPRIVSELVSLFTSLDGRARLSPNR